MTVLDYYSQTARDEPFETFPLLFSLPDSLPPTWTRAGLAALARLLVRGAREPLPFCCAWAPLADGKDEIISSPWREKYNTVTQTRALRWTPTKTWSAQNLTVSSFINCIPAPFYRMSVALVQVNEAEAIPASLLQRTKLLHGSCPCTCFCRPCPWLTWTTTSFQIVPRGRPSATMSTSTSPNRAVCSRDGAHSSTRGGGRMMLDELARPRAVRVLADGRGRGGGRAAGSMGA